MSTATDNTAKTFEEVLVENEWLRVENAALRRRIDCIIKQLYGPRSERIIEQDGQLVFEDLLRELTQLEGQLDDSEEKVAQATAKVAPRGKKRSRKSLQELVPEHLPREDVVIEPPEDERTCPETGRPMVRIGEDVVEKLAHRPGLYYVIRYVYPKYASPDAALSGVVQAARPDFAIPGGVYDESFIANIVVDKCAYHLPLYRQAERLRHQDIDVSRQTLSHLYIKAAEVLMPLFLVFKAIILKSGVIFTDDTTVPLQMKGRNRTVTGRMWVYIGGGNGPPYRVFEFTPDRRKARPKEFIGDFEGYIHADAYKGYEDLFKKDGVVECACWMHVRRKFVDAVDGPPELRAEVLRLIRMLYRYERVLKDKDDATVVAVRQERTGLLIDRIFERTAQAVKDGQILPKSAIAGAIGYLHNRGDALRTFLDDARLRPDNGESERAIRPLAIGRKNWLFAGSERGGDATGVLLSIIQSARVAGLDPFEYITDVLRRINGHRADRLEELLPHNWAPADLYYD